MSIKLMSLVWDIKFPTHPQLLVALKLADFANDDGQSIFPTLNTLADKCQCARSTVSAVLSVFRKVGLLTVVQQGGTTDRPWSSTEYALNASLVKRLADGGSRLTGDASALEIVDVKISPDAAPPPVRPPSPPRPATGHESIIRNHHHLVPTRAKRSEQVSQPTEERAPAPRSQEAPRRKTQPRPLRMPQEIPASEAIAFDRMRRRADGFGVDLSDLDETMQRTRPRAPLAYLETLIVTRLGHTGLAKPALRAALYGETNAVKLLYRVLAGDTR